ncbi:MAG TPA: protoporphyrinogen oxidase [Candidatus Nanopelagicaceae bacterium]
MAPDPDEIEITQPTVAVVGGGISGLMCARRLSQRGVRVILFEASANLGGQIRNAKIAEHDIDLGAEAIHVTAPGMSALINEVGLSGGLIKSNPGTSWLWTERGLQRLPQGVGPSGPRKLGPVLRSRVMTFGGLFRAGLEPLVPRRKLRGDIGVGQYVGKRFGREVVERFVDPVLGSLHAGDVNGLSLRAVTPELAAIADRRRSIMMSRRKQKAGPPLSFATWVGGLTTLTQRMLHDTGVEIRTLSIVESVRALPKGKYSVETARDGATEVDAVVLALPARVAARIVRALSHTAATLLETVRYASVATVIVAYPKSAIEGLKAFKGTGLLVPSSKGRLLKAATFVSTKWSHMEDPDVVFVRLSCGRANEIAIDNLNDAELVAKLHDDLVDATGIKSEPIESYVQRWPNAMPQMEIGHVELIAKIREDLSFFKGIHLAGSSYDGLGIAACLRSGSKAAVAVLSDLDIEKEETVSK